MEYLLRWILLLGCFASAASVGMMLSGNMPLLGVIGTSACVLSTWVALVIKFIGDVDD